jgi:hypothetical protein
VRVLKRRREKLENKDLAAEEAVLQDLFYDMYRYRGRIYHINLIRGIFFGFGSILGGTLLIALLIALLTFLAQIFPPISDFFTWLIQALQRH